MSHHPAQDCSVLFVYNPSDLQEARMVRLNSRAVTITVNLQQYREALALRSPFPGHDSSRFDIVQYEREIRPRPSQAQGVIQFVRGNPGRIKNITDSGREEKLSLL